MTFSAIYACGSPWGIGVYTIEGESIYGYPPRDMNPHDFDPDPECCLADEIAAWKAACAAWDRRNA